jgi:membrane protease YdiL (CAAX protease family)
MFFLAFLVFFVSFIQVFYRFVVIPEDDFDLSMFPWWSLYPCLVMVSVTAGVSEEAGFRGYMQGGLEKRYGPVLAIGITSFVFWLSHLNHASGPARFALLIVMSAALGALAYCAGSIWPSVVTHASVNTIAFVSGAAEVAPWFIRHPASFAETGVDASLVVFVLLFGASTAGLAFVLRKLLTLRVAD